MRSSVTRWNQQSRPAVVIETKSVTFFINGDEFFAGINYVVNHKTTKTFSALLNNLSEKLQPKFGAVRALYDIENGRKIFKLEDLKNSKSYAVAGIEGFRRSEKWLQEPGQTHQLRVSRKPTNQQILPHVTTKASFPASLRRKIYTNKSSKDPITIYVYRNGDFKSTPTKFVLTKQQTIFWDKVLQNISQKVLPEVTYIRNGFRLCSLNGHVLNGVEELSDGQTYVAVGNFETFRRRPYVPIESNKNTLKTVPKWQPPPIIPVALVTPPETDKYDDFEDYEEDEEEDEDEDEPEEEEEEPEVKEVVKEEEVVAYYSDDKFEEVEEHDYERDVEEIEDEYEEKVVVQEPLVQSTSINKIQSLKLTHDNEDEGFHSGPSSSTRDDVIEQSLIQPQAHHHPPIVPEFLKSSPLQTLSPETEDFESIRHSYMGFYDSPLPSYNSTSKAVVAVGSGNRRPSFYYTAATNTFRRSSVVGGETQAEIDKLRLEADPNNVFHAKGENALTRHAPEIQETTDTLVDLPVDFWEAHEVLEEIPEDPPPELEEQNKNDSKFRSSTIAY